MIGLPGTDLVKRASIEELVGHRNRALELYAQAFDLIRAANEAWRRAAPSEPGTSGLDREQLDRLRWTIGNEDRARFLDLTRKRIDSAAWSHLMRATGIGDLMDATQKEKFRKQIADDPPELSVETAAATCFDLAGRAGEIFERSVVAIFERLARRYRSHDGFKIGQRMIVEYAFSMGFWHYSAYSNARDAVRDLDRAFHILDGKPPPDQAADITNRIGAAMQRKETEFECEYFRFRWFRRGTLHIYMLREDLRERANLIIAKHAGAVVGSASGQ